MTSKEIFYICNWGRRHGLTEKDLAEKLGIDVALLRAHYQKAYMEIRDEAMSVIGFGKLELKETEKGALVLDS